MRDTGVTERKRTGSPWRGLWLGLCAAGAVAAMLAVASAVRGADAAAPAAATAGGLWQRGARDPAAMRQHLQLAVDWALRGAGASDDQQQRIAAILQAALSDLEPLREQRRANHRALVEALSAASVDRAAIEAARAQEVALFEQASTRVASALGDAADALTQEQRAALAKLAAALRD